MLDLRIYRAAFVPVLLALVVVAFSLETRPRPIGADLPPDAFDGPRAARLIGDLAERYPDRRPGSEGDLGLAEAVRDTFAAAGFAVESYDVQAETIDGERTIRTVVGERPGRVSSRIVVLAHRDAATAPATAALSATASLLELTRLFAGRTTSRTLTVVSTSGGSGGFAGAEEWASRVRGPVDAVLVLGDLGGAAVRRPQVVGWSNTRGIAPQRLMRTVEQAVREESGPPGASGALMQTLRLAFPLTVSEQGVIGAHGFPAVLLGASGELGPGPDDGVDPERLEALGRGALRAFTALDQGADVRPNGLESVVVLRNQELPLWAVRLLAGVLLLPPLLAGLDGLFRVRRRHEPVLRWIAWVLAVAVPFVVGGLLLVALRLTGLIAAPAAPVVPGAIPVSAGALVAVLAVLALAFLLLWPLSARRLGVGRPDSPGAAAAIGLTVLAVAAMIWVRNPFAALFLVPAVHLWLLAVDRGLSLARSLRIALVLGGLLPFALAALGYALALDAGPLELGWMGALLVAGGHVSFLGILLWSLVAACGVAALASALRSGGDGVASGRPGGVRSRGPITYAGPGSLGGTDSALRR